MIFVSFVVRYQLQISSRLSQRHRSQPVFEQHQQTACESAGPASHKYEMQRRPNHLQDPLHPDPLQRLATLWLRTTLFQHILAPARLPNHQLHQCSRRQYLSDVNPFHDQFHNKRQCHKLQRQHFPVKNAKKSTKLLQLISLKMLNEKEVILMRKRSETTE